MAWGAGAPTAPPGYAYACLSEACDKRAWRVTRGVSNHLVNLEFSIQRIFSLFSEGQATNRQTDRHTEKAGGLQYITWAPRGMVWRVLQALLNQITTR